VTTKEKSVSKKQLVGMIREMVRKELKNRKKIAKDKKPPVQKVSVTELREMIRQALKEVHSRKKKQ
jgi:hypothetical protein